MTRDEYKVRGAGIKTKFEYAEEVLGLKAAYQLRQTVADSLQWPVLVGLWYPFDTYLLVLKGIVNLFHGGRVAKLQEVGSYSAQRVLSSTYRSFTTDERLSHVLERLPNLYERFYNAGRMTLDLNREKRSCHFTFSGAPIYDEHDLQIALGFSKHYWILHGFTALTSNLVVKPQHAEFDLVW